MTPLAGNGTKKGMGILQAMPVWLAENSVSGDKIAINELTIGQPGRDLIQSS